MKQLLIWGGAGIAVAAGLWAVLFFANGSNKQAISTGGTLAIPVSEYDHRKGNPDAKAELVEYGDFQCPACASYFPLLKQLEQEYGDRLEIVYRHFPLRSIHANAQIAAQAAEAAALQGKFWEMHDMLYLNQQHWASDSNPEEKLSEFASRLELDEEQFKSDMDSDILKAKVNTDYDSGELSGVQGTPTFFLQGTRIAVPQTYDELKKVIDESLAEESAPVQVETDADEQIQIEDIQLQISPGT